LKNHVIATPSEPCKAHIESGLTC